MPESITDINPPVVAHADIYKPNTVYVGERKLDGESQESFTFGDGTYVISFAYRKSDPEAMKGAKKAAKQSQFQDRKGQNSRLKVKSKN